MSRTLHHGDRAKERAFGLFHSSGYPQDPTTPKRKRTADRWRWMREPNWWIHEMMNRPHRRRDKRAVAKALRTGDLDVVIVHPKRPYIYYW